MSPDGEAAVDGGRASDAEVMAMTEAMVTFKEVLTDDRTLLKRRKSQQVTGHLRTLGACETIDTYTYSLRCRA